MQASRRLLPRAIIAQNRCPKNRVRLQTAASRRLIALDPETTRILTAHHTSQAGLPQPSGYVFTDRRGAPIRPQQLTNRFREAVHDSGLPPVRLHDLRHGAASLALAAGVDLKAVQEMLGHASIITTADIYAHVLPELHTRAADAAAELVDRAEHPAPPLNH